MEYNEGYICGNCTAAVNLSGALEKRSGEGGENEGRKERAEEEAGDDLGRSLGAEWRGIEWGIVYVTFQGVSHFTSM